MTKSDSKLSIYITGLFCFLFVATTIRWTTTTVEIFLFIFLLFSFYFSKEEIRGFSSIPREQKLFFYSLIFLLFSYLLTFVLGKGWELESIKRPGYPSLTDLDIPERYLMGIFVILFFLRMNFKIKQKFVMYAIGIGGIINGIVALYERYVLGMDRVDGWVGIAEMGTASSLLCLFSLVFLFFTKATKERIFFFVAATMGFTSAFSSATRSVMLGLCMSLIVVMIVMLIRERAKWKIGVAVLSCFLCVFLLLWKFPVGGSDTFRIGAIQSDLGEYQKNNPHTSIGMRFEAWKEAWTMFKMSPIYGMNSAMIMKNAQEIIEVSGTRLRQDNVRSLIGTAHNQYLEALGKRGIIGLSALLVFIATSLGLFVSYLKSKDDGIFKFALMGFLVTFYAIFTSFTGEPWDSMVDTPMFILLMSLFSKLVSQEKNENKNLSHNPC